MGKFTVITTGNVLEKAIRKMPEGLRRVGQGDYDCACPEWFRDMVAFGMNLEGQSFWPASIWNAKAILESIALSKFFVSWRKGCVRCLQLQVTES